MDVKDIASEIKEIQVPEKPGKTVGITDKLSDNSPHGLPDNPTNVDYTDYDRPLNGTFPIDKGWSGVRTICGSGSGPILGSEPSTGRA